MNSNFRRPGQAITSDLLGERLQQALDRRNVVESKFRANHVNNWTVMFCDASRMLKNAVDVDDAQLKTLMEEYRELGVSITNAFSPPFMSPGDGPQMVICFSQPEEAAQAAIEIQAALKKWRDRDDGGEFFIPSIGLHTGDFVIKDDDLKQSNACNMGKRVETEAQPGQITISSVTAKQLRSFENFNVVRSHTAKLKNIPDPQNIYRLEWLNVESNVKAAASSKPGINLDKEDVVIEGEMGILVCDVAGSTKKFWLLGDREGNDLIETFRKEVRWVIQKYKPIHYEIREGDMFVVCFSLDRPIVNVQAATELQKNFFQRNVKLATRERQKLETSIGLHIGNMMIRNGQVIPTPAFSVCKAVQDIAQANEVCMSEVMAERVREYGNLNLEESDEIEVKGLEKPLAVYQLQWYKSTR